MIEFEHLKNHSNRRLAVHTNPATTLFAIDDFPKRFRPLPPSDRNFVGTTKTPIFNGRLHRMAVSAQQLQLRKFALEPRETHGRRITPFSSFGDGLALTHDVRKIETVWAEDLVAVHTRFANPEFEAKR